MTYGYLSSRAAPRGSGQAPQARNPYDEAVEFVESWGFLTPSGAKNDTIPHGILGRVPGYSVWIVRLV
jgi:hypothetical protein